MMRALLAMALLAQVASTQSSYEQSIRAWQQKRDHGLRSPNGWLTLVGLFWLKPGESTIGSAESNDFVLPKGSAPDVVGRLRLANGKVALIRPDGSEQPLSYDEEHPDVVQAGSVSFYAIERGGRVGIRAKDAASPALKSFDGMKYFPISSKFRFEARFIPDPKKIPIHNILGQTEMEDSPGVVTFEYRGATYKLRPITEGPTLFFLFKDATNKTQTYQAGRMLNTPMPVDGKVDLDFNRAYNPPCTFTPYATCPLPPKENTLPFAVEAGEMRYKNGRAEESASLR